MGGEVPGAESKEDDEEDDDSPLEAFLLRLALVAFLFDDPVSFCGDNTFVVNRAHDLKYPVVVDLFPKAIYYAVILPEYCLRRRPWPCSSSPRTCSSATPRERGRAS